MYLLELKNINKSFKNGQNITNLFLNFNLKIKKNESLCILGNSGSGKSSLLHIIGLISQPDFGEIIFNEKIYNKESFLSDKYISQARKKIGFIYQYHHLLAEFTSIENLIIAQLINNIPEKEARIEGEKLLNKMNLIYLKNKKPQEMSGGENQRISILRSIIKKPDLILADEPTGSLDEKNSNLIIELLLYFKDLNKSSIMISTHNNVIAKKINNSIIL